MHLYVAALLNSQNLYHRQGNSIGCDEGWYYLLDEERRQT